jgi:hypothetical protein
MKTSQLQVAVTLDEAAMRKAWLRASQNALFAGARPSKQGSSHGRHPASLIRWLLRQRVSMKHEWLAITAAFPAKVPSGLRHLFWRVASAERASSPALPVHR